MKFEAAIKKSVFTVLILVSSSAFADTKFEWAVVVKDKQKDTLIEGAKVIVSVKDRKNGKEWEESCITASYGGCKIVANASGGGLFSGANIEWKAHCEKDGFTAESKYDFKTFSNTSRSVTFVMTSNEYIESEKRRVEEEQKRAEEREELAAQEKADLMKRLDLASSESVVTCLNKTACEKMFSLAEIYIVKTSDMKIQLATATTIETYNPTEAYKVGLSAVKMPGKGMSSKIMLRSNCKDEADVPSMLCLAKQLSAIQGFKPFMASTFQE